MLAFIRLEPPFDVEGDDPVIIQLEDIAAAFPRRNRGYSEATVILRSGEKVNVGESCTDVLELIQNALRKPGVA